MKKILVGAMLVALVSLTAYTCATYAFGWPLLPQAAPAGVTRGTTSFSIVQFRPLRPESVLLSKGKRAVASSSRKGGSARLANDGKPGTKWTAKGRTFPQWWKVDLGRAYDLTSVRIRWYDSSTRAYGYRISTSLGGRAFTTVADRRGNRAKGATRDSLSIRARFVKVSVTGTTSGAASIVEARVYGVAHSVAPLGSLLSKNRPASASVVRADYPPAAAVDGKTSTKWMGSGMPNWWQVDLGSIRRLSSVQTEFYAGRGYTYSIATSTDGVYFTSQVLPKEAETGTNADGIVVDARYVRLTISRGYESPAILECRVYGDDAAGVPTTWEIRTPLPTPIAIATISPTPTPTQTPAPPPTSVPTPTATSSATRTVLEVTSSNQIDAAIAKAAANPGDYVVWLNGAVFEHGTLTVPDGVHIRGNGIYDQGTVGGGGGTWLQAGLRWGSHVLVEDILVGETDAFRPVPRGNSAAGPDTRANGSHDSRFSFVRFKGRGLDLGVNFGRGWSSATNPVRKYDLVRTVFEDCEWEAPLGTPGSRSPVLNLWIDSRRGGARIEGNWWIRNHFGVKNSVGQYGVGQTVIMQPAPVTPPAGQAGDPDTGPRVGLTVVPGSGSNIDATNWNPAFDWGQIDHGFSDNSFVDSLFEYSDWYPLNFCDWSRLYSMWHGVREGGSPDYGGWGNPIGEKWTAIPDRFWTVGVQMIRSYDKGGASYNNGVSEVHKDSRYIDSTMATGRLTNQAGRYGNLVSGSFSNATRPQTPIFPAGGQWDWTGSRTSYTPSPYDP